MVEDIVGYRFAPTGEELINHYLKNKILNKTWLVENAISEININNYDPMYLPSLAKIQSSDPVWYFFTPKEYISADKNVRKRTTSFGFWKATGLDRIIKDKRGNGVEIGIMKTLVYHQGRFPKGVRTSWVMDEYDITCLPHLQRNYVICQVMYNGEDGDILSGGSNSSELSHSLVSDLNNATAISTPSEVNQSSEENISDFLYLFVNDLIIPMNEQDDLSLWDAFDSNTLLRDQTHNLTETDDEFLGHVNRDQDQLIISRVMYEDRDYYRPRQPLSGIIYDSSSCNDSDAESVSLKSYYQGSSSSNEDFSIWEDETFLKLSSRRKTRKAQFTRRVISSKQEVKQGAIDESMKKESSMVKTKKKGLFILEKAMAKTGKNPPYIYLMNMIIGLILLMALITNIISVSLTVKT